MTDNLMNIVIETLGTNALFLVPRSEIWSQSAENWNLTTIDLFWGVLKISKIFEKSKYFSKSWFFLKFSKKSTFFGLESCFFWNSSHLIGLVEVVTDIRCMLWVAQKKALDLYFRLRYSAQECDTARSVFGSKKYVKKSLDPTEIALEISHATMKRPQKIQMQKNQLTYFSKNQKLLKSTYGARRTVMLKYLDVLGGSLRIPAFPLTSTSFGDSCIHSVV